MLAKYALCAWNTLGSSALWPPLLGLLYLHED